jgi:CRP-like cAMP-binding protein
MLSIVEKVFRLHGIRLFASLKTPELQALASIAELASFGAGERIITEGEVGDFLFVLLQGTVLVSTEKGGPRVELARLGAGHVFGEMAILTEEVRSANVDALDECHCLTIAREPFRSLIEERPQIAFGVFQSLSERLREADRKLGESSPTPPKA